MSEPPRARGLVLRQVVPPVLLCLLAAAAVVGGRLAHAALLPHDSSVPPDEAACSAERVRVVIVDGHSKSAITIGTGSRFQLLRKGWPEHLWLAAVPRASAEMSLRAFIGRSHAPFASATLLPGQSLRLSPPGWHVPNLSVEYQGRDDEAAAH